MPRFKGVASLIALLILSTSPVSAGPEQIAQLVITVIDASNDPIVGAIVGLSEQAPLLNTSLTNVELAKRTLRCDSRGECAASDLPAGNYSIDVRTPSVSVTLQNPIALTSGRPQRLIIRVSGITATLIASLGTVRITPTGTLSTASAPSAELSSESLAERGAQSAVQLLSEQPGITLNRLEGGAAGLPVAITLRGADPKETILQIDGHAINSSNSGDFDVSLLDPSAFSSVQVLYGLAPASLIGANTEGGTVNFHTLEPSIVPHGFLRYASGSFVSNGYTVATTGSANRFGYALALHSYNQQGEVANYPVLDATNGQIARLGSGITGSSGLVKLRYTLGTEGMFEASVLTLASNRDLSAALSTPLDPHITSPGAPFTNYAGSARRNVNTFYNADLLVPIGAKNSQNTSSAFMSLRHMTSLGRQNVIGPANGLSEYFLDNSDRLEDNSIEYERLLPDADLTIVARFNAERLTTPAQFGPASPTQTQTSRYLLGRYEWRGGEHLQYTASTYYSYFSGVGTNLSPRAGVVWTPNPKMVLRASIGSGFQPPLLSEKIIPSPLPPSDQNGLISVGNPNLRPDYTTEYELDEEQWLGIGPLATRSEIDLYRVNQRDDDLLFIPSGASPSNPKLSYPVNIARSVWQGLGLKLDVPLKGSMTISGAYDINQTYPLTLPTTFQGDTGNLVPFQQYQSVPMHRASLSFQQQRKPLSWMIGMAYEGSNNDLGRPPFATVSASIKYSRNHTDLVLAAGNLTNVYAGKFTLIGAGVPYPGLNGPIPSDAYALQAPSLTGTITQRW